MFRYLKHVLTLLCLSVALSVALPNEAQAGTRALASYYDLSGATTASGDTLTASSWTTAHWTLPFGTEVTVCYAHTCAHNVVVNDRGPAPWTGRDFDLHIAVAEALGMTSAGEVSVRWYVETPGRYDGNDLSYVR